MVVLAAIKLIADASEIISQFVASKPIDGSKGNDPNVIAAGKEHGLQINIAEVHVHFHHAQ